LKKSKTPRGDPIGVLFAVAKAGVRMGVVGKKLHRALLVVVVHRTLGAVVGNNFRSVCGRKRADVKASM
jgi:hypothetical protein